MLFGGDDVSVVRLGHRCVQASVGSCANHDQCREWDEFHAVLFREWLNNVQKLAASEAFSCVTKVKVSPECAVLAQV